MANKHTMMTSLALLALLGCAPQSNEKTTADSAATAAADPAAVRAAIDAANATATEALNKGDVETWLTLYKSDAVVLPPNQPAWRGTDGMRAGAQAMLKELTISGAAFSVEDIKTSGDFAVETGAYTMTMTPKKGGKAINDKGKYIVVWERQPDGSWKITRDIFNSDLPASG
ncbi:MAG TPA: SgcJ/EcaC family oxidoreductase [Gemmatimonadaceae bacterium]|jgi:uncharacterized protein (TIGR02246 family)|nr:SgcJ/EcaC family oxidoreductase [Gemmatimonadaceae bacterium]